MMPSPRAHLVRYGSVFGPNVRLRPAVVPKRLAQSVDAGLFDRLSAVFDALARDARE
jgi:hypothetical protein